MSSLFFIAPLHLPQRFRSKSPSFRSRASVAPSPAVRSKSLIAPAPVFYSPSSHDSFYPPADAPEFEVRSRILLRERMIFLVGKVNNSVAHAICRQFVILDKEDPTKDIRLFISSSGGLLSIGLVASPISIVLYGGARGKRLSTPRTRLQMGPIGTGGASDHAKKIITIVGKKNNHYITAANAVKLGIVDEIFDEL